MTLESFYGGKQGLSSIIKKAFRYISVQDPAYIALSDSAKSEALANKEVMEECLKDNSYKEVWYGELCIINTYNKNNPANGCLFRRTLARQGSRYPTEIYKGTSLQTDNLNALSAEYIGQIVGPKSGTPFLQMVGLEDVDDRANTELELYDETAWERNESWVDENNQIRQAPHVVYDELLTDSKHPDDVDTYRHNALGSIFKPGKEYTLNNSEDKILYNWFNIRKGNDDESWMYLGLEIPFYQMEFEPTFVRYFDDFNVENPYEDRKFYDKWHIEFPRGVRGNAASDIFITSLRQTPEVYRSFEAITQDDTIFSFDDLELLTATYIDDLLGEDNRDTKNVLDVPFYCCKYTIYNENDDDALGHSAYFFIGLVRHVDSFSLSHDGHVTVHYSDDIYQTLEEPIIWIDNITVGATNADTDDGVLEITYNNADATENWTKRFQLVLPKNIEYTDETGKFTVTNTGGTEYDMTGVIRHPQTISYVDDIGQFHVINNLGEDNYTDPDNPIEYIKDIKYNDSTGEFTVTTNIVESGEHHSYIVNAEDIVDYVKNIEFDEKSGFFNITTNTGRTFTANENAIIFPNNITFSEDGIFTIHNSDDSNIVLNAEHPVKWVRNISLVGDIDKTDATSADTDRRIQYTDNQSDIVHSLGDEINYVQEFIKGDDGHLYVLFNAKSHRYTVEGKPKDSTYDAEKYRLSGDDTLMYPREVTDDNGYTWRNDIDSSYAANIYWRDYGQSIGYHKGLYVGKVIPLTKNGDGTWKYNDTYPVILNGDSNKIIEILNAEYPQGFNSVTTIQNGTVDRRGMLAVVRMSNLDYPTKYDSYYFAYNYDDNTWYLIQVIEGVTLGSSLAIKDENGVEIETQDAYISITNWNAARPITMNAPWVVSSYYVLSAT